MATFGNSWKEDNEDDINMFSRWKDDDSDPEPNDALKSAKEKYDKQVPPYVSDDFQIGPEGAYEHVEDTTWDEVYNEYTGISDLHDFVEWLKENFKTPNRL